MKIEEPKTPYHRASDSGSDPEHDTDDLSSSPHTHTDGLSAHLVEELNARLAESERLQSEMGDLPLPTEERAQKALQRAKEFEEKRKRHYDEFQKLREWRNRHSSASSSSSSDSDSD